LHSKIVIIAIMNSNHRKTLEAIFAKPTAATLEWARIESLLVAAFHRPHPAKEAKPYQVEDARTFLELIGIKP